MTYRPTIITTKAEMSSGSSGATAGLYYLNSRYYDPEVGRFLNTDSAMGVNGDMATYNLFVYCGNNPLRSRYPACLRTMPSGLRKCIRTTEDRRYPDIQQGHNHFLENFYPSLDRRRFCGYTEVE